MEEQTVAGNSEPGPATEPAGTNQAGKPGWSEWIRQGLRAAALLPIKRLPEGPGAWPMLLIVLAAAVIVSGAARLEVDGPAIFDLRSWLFGWAPAALMIGGVWLVLSWSRDKVAHASPVAAWYLLYTVATVPLGVVGSALNAYAGEWWSEGTSLAWGLYVALWVWLLLVLWRISRAVTVSARVAASLLLCVFVLQLVSSFQLATREWQASTDPFADEREDEFIGLELSQEVFENQQQLLQDSLQAIVPSNGNERQTFGLVYAPYDQDVFLRESAMVKQVLEDRFGARDRVVRLVNNAATANELPWATTLNLKRSLRALAEAMNTERDVLIVYLTSHGGDDFKLAAQHWPLDVEDLTAEQLRTMLDEFGIRHRVIAVSACYSGGWIEPLQNDDTLVMTAADKDHTSYGCGSRSELTFFGRAVFDEQLRQTLSFEEAFEAAVPVIKQREIDAKKDDGFSNPQISIGKNIRAVLDELARMR